MATYSEMMDVIERHQTHWPVETVPIAEDLGLKVYHVSDWPDDLSGMIKESNRGGPSGYAIYVNGNHHRNRRRFTIAHEIAHFVVHRHLIGDGVADDALYRSRLSGPEETQANKLAADILVPWHLIHKAMREGYEDVTSLARIFEVSESAMSIRIGVPFES